MMQSKNFYPVYKEIESNLISQFPSHWLWSKLKYVANLSGRIGFRGYTVNDIVDEGNGAITLSPSNIIDGEMSLNKKTYISWEKYYESPEIMIKENDILFCKTGSSYGKSAIVERLIEPMTINPQLVVIKPKDNISPAFLAYLMESSFIKDQVELIVGGGTMPTISQEDLLAMNVLRPSKSEQKTIVNYLNKKCFEVNELIQTKLRLINLLEEKRQAITTEAVTEGLNPNVKMKDSGVEWIGEIPEHWEVKKIKYACRLRNEKAEAGYDLEFLGLENIESKTGKLLRDVETENNEGIANLYYKGDVLFGKLRLYLTKCILAESDGKCTTEALVLEVNSEMLNNKFLKYLLLSHKFIDEVNSSTFGAKMPRASWGFIGNTTFPLPSLEEQREIICELESKILNLDAVTSIIKEQIQKFKEYRQSLIYEAVTGKIDVRDIEIDS